MDKVHITKEQARRFLLVHQGLWPPRELEGKQGVLSFIERVGCIQFDPLNIVGNNPELVLQARVADFTPDVLKDLLYEDRRLLDGWDKMMAIYRLEDWPLFRRQREAAERRYGEELLPVAAVVPQVREAIRERGPLSSIDLDHNDTVDWPWAPTRLARAALESMYWWGELIVHHKVHTRKVYDFADRHIPRVLLDAPDPSASAAEYRDWRVERRIGGVGLLGANSGDVWLAIPGVKAKERAESLERLLRAERVVEVAVESVAAPFYMRSRDLPTLDRVLSSGKSSRQAVVLAPLDNLLWDRRQVKELFGFDYRWEVYKPSEQRSYGYYVLPVLRGDRFVARFEPGRDKRTRAMVIKRWWWEPGVRQSERLRSDLCRCFRSFLGFLGLRSLQVGQSAMEQVPWLAEL